MDAKAAVVAVVPAVTGTTAATTTQSESFVDAQTLTDTFDAGSYVVLYQAELNNNSVGAYAAANALVDGTSVAETQVEPQDATD